MKGQMTVVLPKEAEEALVILEGHVEQLNENPVASVRSFESNLHNAAELRAREVAGHEKRIDGGPKRFTSVEHRRGEKLSLTRANDRFRGAMPV